MRRLVRLLALLTLAVSCLPVAPATALPFPVTSTSDTTEEGTLRWAIEEANARPGADAIPIEVTGTIELGSPLPGIVNSLSIAGPGAADLTIEREAGAAPFRILTFPDNPLSIVRDVTISGGLDPRGAGILSEAESLMLIGVVVAGNEARAEGGAGVARGGGVASSGSLTVLDSTIAGNVAIAEAGASQTLAAGGGIDALGPLTLERSTVSGNAVRAFAASGDPAVAEGGGVRAVQLGIVSATIAGNESSSDGVALGANLESTGTSLVRNMIVSDPQGDVGSCSGAVTSGGFNLDEDGSCGFDEGSDLVGLDPLLGPLAANGGPTPTHALLSGSPAIDRGAAFGQTSDQRGLPRRVDFSTASNSEGGDGSDIGAFELQALAGGDKPAPPPILVGATAGDRTAPNTRIVRAPPRVSFKRLARFIFNSTESQSSFQCKVDKGKWRGCRSPFKRKVSAGAKHLFKVRAIDRFGNVDPSPARFGWRVKALS